MREGIVKVIYTSNEGNNDVTDITDIIEDMTISTSLGTQAGRCDVNIVGDGASFTLGSRLQIYDGENGVFCGYLMSVSMQDENRFTATFYDQLRYLKNVDVLTYKNITATELFRVICGVSKSLTQYNPDYSGQQIDLGVIDESTYRLPPTVSEGKSYFDMMQDAIDQTLAYEGKYFIIRDVFGKLEFRDIENLRTDFVIDDEGTGLGYSYTIGIDRNSYNQVKVGYENQDAGAREWGIAYDQELINKWGVIQYYQLLKNKLSQTELDNRAWQQLTLVARPTRDVSITCFGDFRISAGSGVSLSLPKVRAFNGLNRFYVTSCEHHVTCDSHTMELTLGIDNLGGRV